MDSIFNLEPSERSNLLQRIVESFGLTYVCLWSLPHHHHHHHHHSNCLVFFDGVYKEERNQASSSSSGNLALRSFVDYQKSMFLIDNYSGRVPGLAFMHNLAYMERKGLELFNVVSNSMQLQFYQEARIKTAIFMGCENGEIELGMSQESSQINLESELKKLFPGDFPQEVVTQSLDQTKPSSSSSSLRSLSMENSIDYPPFLFNMLQPTTPLQEIFTFNEPILDQKHSPNNQTQTPTTTTTTQEQQQLDPLQQTLTQIRTNQLLPSREHEEAAMTRAILAAISSSSPPSSSSNQITPSRQMESAFSRYRTYPGAMKRGRNQNRQNMNMRSLAFFRNLNEAQAQQEYRMVQTTRPTSNQLHHMMSERKRREKINESLHALRSVLPPGSKKDKASVLSNTKEYIKSLKSQVEELEKRNMILEAEKKEILNQDSDDYSDERLVIGIRDVEESTSESRVVDLEVNIRGGSVLADLVARVLEFLKRVKTVTVMSIDARTQILEPETTRNRIVLRLRIQGSEWDRSSFQEAVTRVLDDLAQ